MRLNSYDEWSPLKEVIVGSGVGYTPHHVDSSFALFFDEDAHEDLCASCAPRPAGVARPFGPKQRYVEELCEDVEELAGALRSCGVTVHRPVPRSAPADCRTPYWHAPQLPALNIRDQVLVLGDELVETPPQVRARYFENDLLKPVFYDYFRQGAKWTVMPRPMMTEASFDSSGVTGRRHPGSGPGALPSGSDRPSPYDVGPEMMIDAAQCLRFGRDVLVNVSAAHHALAADWLSRHYAGRFRFHRLTGFGDNHIDTLALPLRPGLLLVRNPRVAEALPEPLRRWDRVYAPEPSEHDFPRYDADDLVLTSLNIDMNVLSVDEGTVVVNALAPRLVRTLERRGFTVVPVRHRHRRLFSGGFHCFTLDTVRAGSSLDDHFS